MERTYICIDLKSFYASVECAERKLDPLTTNLVVADSIRTEKTICLAVSPSLKEYGIGGRARLFEVVEKVRQVNKERRKNNKYYKFSGKSHDAIKLKQNKNLELDYIIAPPRMNLYIKYSAEIYSIYLKYIAPEDIYVYSIDEVFCDITPYLNRYKSAEELVTKMIKEVYDKTKITATAGIGTNLYLAKVAMDIVAKKTKPNSFGVRIAFLNEERYRNLLWSHKPITDFWRIGKGYSEKLAKHNMFTMGDIARCSLEKEELLYKLFGVNAELLIDHAFGYEPCTMNDIKSYKPVSTSISSGQVLHEPYDFKKSEIIIKEIADILSLELIKKKLVTDKIILNIVYDAESLTDSNIRNHYFGEIIIDSYGRKIPKSAHGTINLEYKTSANTIIMQKTLELFNKIVNRNLLIRKVNLTFAHTTKEDKTRKIYKQFDIFSNIEEEENNKKIELNREKNDKILQEIVLKIKDKFGKNSIIKAMDLEDGATTIDRNNQIGGHKA